jgi:cation diffusion facilitator CzcD-associated flavoprotein CzcO
MGRRVDTGTVIVGAGFSGLGMAVQLRKQGRDDFVILEKAEDVGGVWRDNTYPGCGCDIPSHMYSFSFEQNPAWTRAYSPQAEIWDYLRGVAKKYDLYHHIRFGQEMIGARWDADQHRWHVTTRSGDEFTGRFVVNGIGSLHQPNVPQLPGIERFAGPAFHSSQWDHDVDLRGKRVAVIGTGASAIQFVPHIAPEVARLDVFQRTPPWIMSKPDRAISNRTRGLFRTVPGAQRTYRSLLYWLLESRAVGFNGHPGIFKVAQRTAKAHLDRAITNPALRAKLTPDYLMGCKRILFSNDYYPALDRPNVEVVTDGVAEVREHGIVDTAGVEHPADVIIYGTGFHVIDAFDKVEIIGADGRNLAKEWASEGNRTHLGITVSGFPNLFLLLGPNTALGHHSVIFMIESQARYIGKALELLDRAGADALVPRLDVQQRFNAEVQRKLARGVWSQGGCKSWYLDAEGVNRTIWPGFTWRYWLTTRRVRPAEFELIGTTGSS